MTPSVGRIVHYVSHGTPVREDGTPAYTAQCRAAIITEVGGWPEGETSEAERRNIAVPVGLAVLNPTGMFFHSIADGGCMQSELGHEGGSWHWPERVEAPLSAPECMCTPAGECGKCWEKRQQRGASE